MNKRGQDVILDQHSFSEMLQWTRALDPRPYCTGLIQTVWTANRRWKVIAPLPVCHFVMQHICTSSAYSLLPCGCKDRQSNPKGPPPFTLAAFHFALPSHTLPFQTHFLNQLIGIPQNKFPSPKLSTFFFFLKMAFLQYHLSGQCLSIFEVLDSVLRIEAPYWMVSQRSQRYKRDTNSSKGMMTPKFFQSATRFPPTVCCDIIKILSTRQVWVRIKQISNWWDTKLHFKGF